MNRLKLFLGAYINNNNAQNLNCVALAKYLDKSLFDIRVLSLYSEPSKEIEGVKVFKCIWPHRILVYWAYFWNIIHADVVYLPKGELLGFNSFLCQLFKKKSFSTIEGILDDTNYEKAKNSSGDEVLKFYPRLTKVYSISTFIKKYNEKKHQLLTDDKILELGTESDIYTNSNKTYKPLTQVILIANNYNLKGIDDFIALANHYSNIEFHLIGEGKPSPTNFPNLILHGKLSQVELSTLLKKIQLHVFPSRSEGFPKVILETACAGVPSLVYSDYGAQDWIEHSKTGFVVNTLEEMKNIIDELAPNEKLIEKVSKNAIQLGLSFDWKLKVKAWEEVILSLNSSEE